MFFKMLSFFVKWRVNFYLWMFSGLKMVLVLGGVRVSCNKIKYVFWINIKESIVFFG